MNELRELRHRSHADRCLECGKCSSMCPLGNRGDFSARRIAGQDLTAELQGHGVGVGRCLTCRSCEERCPQGVRFTEFVRGLRELVPLAQRRPCPHAAVLRHGAAIFAENPKAQRDLSWIGADLRVAEEGETALFVGCLPNFDAVFSERLGIATLDIARAAIRLLNRKGIEPVVLRQERCCGHDQLWSGDRRGYERLARANLEAYHARGIREVLSVCAECTRTWREDYPRLGAEPVPRAMHVLEWLAEDGHTPTYRGPSDGASELVTYQDPCRLGRHLGVYDPPREVIDTLPGVELVEMSRAGRDAICCGTSGFLHCDAQSRRLQHDRLASAKAAGAGTLLTACPKCWIHFRCAQHDDGRQGEESSLEVMDLTLFSASKLDLEAELVSSPGDGEMGVV